MFLFAKRFIHFFQEMLVAMLQKQIQTVGAFDVAKKWNWWKKANLFDFFIRCYFLFSYGLLFTFSWTCSLWLPSKFFKSSLTSCAMRKHQTNSSLVDMLDTLWDPCTWCLCLEKF